MERIIAVPVTAGVVSAHFGHCEQFYFVQTNEAEITKEWFVTPPVHEPGLYPKWVKEQGAVIVIAGGMGQKAVNLFDAQNISTYTGAQSQAPKAIVEAFLSSTLQLTANICNHEHHDHNHDHKCE